MRCLLLYPYPVESDGVSLQGHYLARGLRNLGVEVIEIGVSNYELLRVLRPYIFTNRKVAVVGFRSLTDSVEQICKILDIPVICFPVDSELEVESKIRSVADHKIECVIGDMIWHEGGGHQ